MTAGTQKRRRAAFTLHLRKQKHLNPPPPHHMSFPCLHLLPVCPSLSTAGPQTHNLNDEWDGKPKASAFRMTRRRGGGTWYSRSLTLPAPFPFITKLNLVMKEPCEG